MVTVKLVTVVAWLLLVVLLIGIWLVFDPLGHRYKERHARGAGHLESTHQQMDGCTAAAKRLWENR